MSVTGRINLWGDIDPESGDPPDHVLAGQWLVDCCVADYGPTPGGDVRKPLAFTLSFADHRHGFLSTRGRLCQGLGNPDPLEDEPLAPDSDLIGACLSATGVLASVPGSVNNTDAMRQFEGFGTHAPTGSPGCTRWQPPPTGTGGGNSKALTWARCPPSRRDRSAFNGRSIGNQAGFAGREKAGAGCPAFGACGRFCRLRDSFRQPA